MMFISWLSSVFQLILYLTILGSVVAACILIIKFFIRDKLGARWSYWVWVLLLLRLLIPYAPQSSFSVFTLLNYGNSIVSEINLGSTLKYIKTMADPNSSKTLILSPQITGNQQQQTYNHGQVSPKNTITLAELIFKLAAVIWFVGVIILILVTILKMTIFYLKLMKEKPCSDEEYTDVLNKCKDNMGIKSKIMIVKTDLVSTPSVLGGLRPKILLPMAIDEQVSVKELEFIILHEMAHLKQKDIMSSYITRGLQILHWFNPILWYSFYRMYQDRELACDALALSYINSEECVKYGGTIIKLIESYKKTTSSYGIAGIISSKSQIKRRITMISLFKRTSFKVSIASLIVLIAMGGIMLTNSRTTPTKTIDKKATSVLTPQSISAYQITKKNFKSEYLTINNPTSFVVGFDKQSFTSTETTSQIAKENNAICAINAGQYKEGSPNPYSIVPKGFIIHDSKVVYNDSKNESDVQNVVGFTKSGSLIIGEHSISQLKKLGIKEAVVSGTPLVVNGTPVELSADLEMGRDARTAIGQKKDGSIILVVINGRQIDSPGASIVDMQNILIQLGAVNASNLLGNGYSTMYYQGKVINRGDTAEIAVPSTFMVLQ